MWIIIVPLLEVRKYLESLPPTENLDPEDKDEQAKEGDGTEASYQGSKRHGGRPEEEKYDADQNCLETSFLILGGIAGGWVLQQTTN